jgi:hypothetical protein
LPSAAVVKYSLTTILLQLPFIKDVLQVQADVLFGGLEQFGHGRLIQPDAFLLQANLDARPAVLSNPQLAISTCLIRGKLLQEILAPMAHVPQ